MKSKLWPEGKGWGSLKEKVFLGDNMSKTRDKREDDILLELGFFFSEAWAKYRNILRKK